MDTIKPISQKRGPVRRKPGKVTPATKWVLRITALLVLVFFCGRLNLYLRFSGDVARLLANATDVSANKFNYHQLDGLPNPVQQYFRHVLRPGQSYISSVHLLHTGLFKTNLKKGWVSISGEEYFTAHRPGFVWKGKTATFTARDMFVDGNGRLVVHLFSLFQIQDSQGPQFNRGELMRWLGESVCFPTNLLPSRGLKWYPIDERSARLEYSFQGMWISLMVTFNAAHEIEQMTAMRNMGDGPRQKWVTRLSDYQLRDGIRIPTVLEAAWDLPEGYFPYARFSITEIEYNKTL